MDLFLEGYTYLELYWGRCFDWSVKLFLEGGHSKVPN